MELSAWTKAKTKASSTLWLLVVFTAMELTA